MTDAELLDHNAGLAMQAILASNLVPEITGRDVAKLAYDYAQHMLDERQERWDVKHGIERHERVDYVWVRPGELVV